MAFSRLDKAESLVFPTARPPFRFQKAAISYCIIDLVDLWGAFIRALYVSSALGATIGKSRKIGCARPFTLAIDAFTFSAAWKFSRSAAGRRAGAVTPPYSREAEPAWHHSNNVANLAVTLALTNQPSISAGLARAGSTPDDLIAFRNFFAHRNEETRAIAATRLYRYAITPRATLEESLYAHVPGYAVTLIELWFGDLRDAIDRLTR
jgi:hypothetical protein